MSTEVKVGPITEAAIKAYSRDGIPIGLTWCPICHRRAVVIAHYLGGYGYHNAYRCQANPEHGAPLFYDQKAGRYLPGVYYRELRRVSFMILPAAPFRQSVTIRARLGAMVEAVKTYQKERGYRGTLVAIAAAVTVAVAAYTAKNKRKR